MDHQQSQPPPFARNAASPYHPSPYHAPSHSQGSYPPSASHPPLPNSHPIYSDHQRRTSDPIQPSVNPYYQSHPGPQPSQPPPPHHQRHQSSSSISSVPPLNRGAMPPPGSPPQQAPHYGLPAPRAPPVSVGPPTSFPNGRELPALNSLPRAHSAGSSMSIASMLGGGGGGDRPQSSAQYPPPSTSASISGPPAYSTGVHASPRIQGSSVEYGSRFRPHTPDLIRPYDPRDPRGSNAASPQQGMHNTPEVPRYGTPQTSVYGRAPPGPPEQYRDQRTQPAPMPPRPSSTQPQSYQTTPRQVMEVNRGHPPQPEHGIYRREEPPAKFAPDRPMEAYDERMIVMERERQEREMEIRERERRERALSGSDGHRQFHAEYRAPFPADPRDQIGCDGREIRDPRDVRGEIAGPREMREARETMDSRGIRGDTVGQRELREARDMRDYRDRAMRDPREVRDHLDMRDPRDTRDLRDLREHRDLHDSRELSRDPREARDYRDSREATQWRPPYDQRLPYDPAGPPQARPSEYPPTNTTQYSQSPSYQHQQERFPPASQPSQQPPSQTRPSPSQPFESPERPRMFMHHQQSPLPQHPQQQQPPQPSRPMIQEPPPPQPAYGPDSMYDRPREEVPPPSLQNRNLIQIEINKKGRLSPLPQAVKGAQPQAQGPSGEPVIKNEFGRIFSGIGAVVSSPITPSAHLSFPNPGGRRDEDGHLESEPKPTVNRTKRRKAKEDELRGDDESGGRLTPVNHRAKRPKAHPHPHHQYVLDSPLKAARSLTKLSNHHHHANSAEQAASQVKGPKGATPGPSPVSKDFPTTHQHHLPRSRPAPSSPVQLPKVHKVVSSREVLDSVADRPRNHIGDMVYASKLKTPKHFDPDRPGPSRYGFASTPEPLPMDRIEGRENCTLTVKVSRAYLHGVPLEEITRRRALWGTDVYTDDSDVVAACIHGGWIRGAWPEDVNAKALDIGPGPTQTPEYITAPPTEGPVNIPPDLDMHVTVVILPCLEKYSSTARFGIRSRQWGGGRAFDSSIQHQNGEFLHHHSTKHDGLSFMVLAVRFTDGAQPQSRLRGKGRRERMRRALEQVQRSRFVDLSAAPAPTISRHSVAGSKRGAAGEGGKENDRPEAGASHGHTHQQQHQEVIIA